MEATATEGLRRLIEKGVCVSKPESVEIGDDVDPERISGEGVVIHPGCRISGSGTLIMSGTVLGSEAPVTVKDCRLGKNVRLEGGFFAGSCFLDGARVGSGAQVREACLMEEEARCAHTVGLKHTILFPYVTLGSLINFCDCLMAGGTDPKNHSEVGSSYIHFNYTPQQDKATPSRFGDVPRGVMLNQPPVFLGGQGGVVGPVRVEYGVVAAAGTIVRKDLLKGGMMLLGHRSFERSMPFRPGLYTQIKRLVERNTEYIGHLKALRLWYVHVRSRIAGEDPMRKALVSGAMECLTRAVGERIKRLGELAERMPRSMALQEEASPGKPPGKIIRQSREFHEQWSRLEKALRAPFEEDEETRRRREAFIGFLDRALESRGRDYLGVVKALDAREAEAGSRWLQSVVDGTVRLVGTVLPGFETGKGL